jgi:hypothetical protein
VLNPSQAVVGAIDDRPLTWKPPKIGQNIVGENKDATQVTWTRKSVWQTILEYCATKMDIRYSYKTEDFEEIAEVVNKLAPRRHVIRLALVCVGVLLLIAPFLTGSGPSHPDPF